MSSFIFDEDVKIAKGEIEAILFVAGDTLSIEDISSCLEKDEATIKKAIDELIDEFNKPNRGISIRVINGRVQLHTKKEHSDVVEKYLQPEVDRKFSKSLMETLSVVAYKQPITRSEIEDLRGVRCEYAINRLLGMALIEEVGRKQVLGRPALFGTSDLFLEKFNISDLSLLPNRDVFDMENREEVNFEEN